MAISAKEINAKKKKRKEKRKPKKPRLMHRSLFTSCAKVESSFSLVSSRARLPTAVSHPAFGEMATASSISRCQAVAMHMGHWTRMVRRSCTRRCLVWLSSLVDEEGSQTGRITVRALKYILWEEFFGIITTEWLEKFKFLRFAARTWDLR